MAQKLPIPDYALHACEECIHAAYDTDERNRNIQTGEPILVVCALHPFPKIVVGTRACEHFTERKRDVLSRQVSI